MKRMYMHDILLETFEDGPTIAKQSRRERRAMDRQAQCDERGCRQPGVFIDGGKRNCLQHTTGIWRGTK